MKKYIIWLISVTVLALATLAILQLQLKGLGEKLNRQGGVIDSMQRKLELLERADSALLDSIRQLSIVVEQASDSSLASGSPEMPKEEARRPVAYEAPARQSAASRLPASGNGTLKDSYLAVKGVPLSGGVRFDIFRVNPQKVKVEFFHRYGGQVIGNIQRLRSLLQGQSKKLVFATNGGMFEKNLAPAGLYVEAGVEFYPLNLRAGGAAYTNFYDLPPNGVFYITKGNVAGIVKKEGYPGISPDVAYATQSGPMVVINGKINPQFKKNSSSKFIRSGVGVRQDGSLVFAISQQPVTFYDFARIFMYYGCRNALYLDGAISEMYLPEIGRYRSANEFALMIAVTEKM